MPKSEFASRDYCDVWLPMLAPSQELVVKARAVQTPAECDGFVSAYLREMSAPDIGRLLDLLAAFSHSASFSIGCYCEDESRCHRSVLRRLLWERDAEFA